MQPLSSFPAFGVVSSFV